MLPEARMARWRRSFSVVPCGQTASLYACFRVHWRVPCLSLRSQPYVAWHAARVLFAALLQSRFRCMPKAADRRNAVTAGGPNPWQVGG